MFTHNYKNRFDMNLTDTNILMTQIRAEKKIYTHKHAQPISSYREERYGKRVYQEILSRPSLSPQAKDSKAYNFARRERARMMLLQTSNRVEERSHSGRRRFDESYKKDMQKRISKQKSGTPGRRRLDHSPSQQHLKSNWTLRWD